MKKIFLTVFGLFLFLPMTAFAVTIDQDTFDRGYTLTDGDAALAIIPQVHDTATIEFSHEDKIATVTVSPKSPFDGVIVLPKAASSYAAVFYRASASDDWTQVGQASSGTEQVRYHGEIKQGQYTVKNVTSFLYTTQRASVRLDEPTVVKGYTISIPNLLDVGIVPNSVQENVRITIAGETKTSYDAPEGLTRISPLMVFDVYHPDVVDVQKPILLSLKFESDSDTEKTLQYYDRIKQRWIPLPTVIDLENNRAHAVTWLPFAHIAVFENPNHMQLGQGSWYGADHVGVANNDYPYGTLLRVTNLDNGKDVIAPVVSTGPFVAGRIVDLTRQAFERIANPSTGVINVKVEHVF